LTISNISAGSAIPTPGVMATTYSCEAISFSPFTFTQRRKRAEPLLLGGREIGDGVDVGSMLVKSEL
jgi:hypothetical protein